MELNNFEINHQKDDSYYIIDLDSGISYTFEAYLKVRKESTPATREEPGEAAEYDTWLTKIEMFDDESMSLGFVKSKILTKQLHLIMHNYFKEDADEYHEEAGDINFE